MHPKGIVSIVLIFSGLIYLQAASAGTRDLGIRAELVAVLNTNPANPLGGEIWLMNLDGRLVRRITKNDYHEEYPRFSPDGSKIAFVRNMGGVAPGIGIDPRQNEIFVYDLRTGIETRLTGNNVEDGDPEWSYDGKYIAFYSRRSHPEEKATLWIMESDGSRPRRILSLQQGDVAHLNPDWSPDGQWLAFVNYREEAGMQHFRVEKVRIDGSQRTVVSSGGRYPRVAGSGREEPLGDLDPNHSPDGAMIWSARRIGGGQMHLFSFGAGAYYGGKAEIDMDWTVHPDGVEASPRFSPDGRRIVLTRSSFKATRRSRQIVLTDPQSSFRRYLTSREDWDLWHPSWYPFAYSGAERDAASTVASYSASRPGPGKALSPQKDGTVSTPSGTRGHQGVRFLLTNIQLPDPRTSQAAAHEVGWKLELAPERVNSLTLRFQGRINGDKAEGKSLQFQLMDWEEKRWVTVLTQPEVASDRIKILHEMAPAHFVSRDKGEVLLRIVAIGGHSASALILEVDYLSLDVRRN